MSEIHGDEELLLAYALDELEAGEHDRAAAHLTTCAECRRAADAFRSVAAALRQTPRGEAPSGVLTSLLEAQARSASPAEEHGRHSRPAARPALGAPRSFRPARIVAAAAVLALCVSAGFWAGRLSVPEATDPAAAPASATAPTTAEHAAPEQLPARSELPDPPRIPFASA